VLRLDEASSGPDARLVELIDEFSKIVNTKTFPCTFSTLPYTTGEIYFSRVHAKTDPAKYVLTELKELCRTIIKSPEAVGIIFVDDGRARTLEDDFALASDIVQHVIRATASSPGNADLPKPDDPWWTLWLDGIGLFVNFSTPNHRARRSRNVGSVFTLIAQARAAFDRLNRASPRARDEIRQRLRSYDDVPPHPALGAYSDPASREAWQYFLGDTTEAYDPTEACPQDASR
jgi:FPC/CPF motif-containing protein YcgG